MAISFLGLEKIKDWTQQSLKKRLSKSLSHDWIHEEISHKFPLRQYYVQLEWKKKISTAMGSKYVTLTSIHDVINQLISSHTEQESPGARASNTTHDSTSVIIEGKTEEMFQSGLPVRPARLFFAIFLAILVVGASDPYKYVNLNLVFHTRFRLLCL